MLQRHNPISGTISVAARPVSQGLTEPDLATLDLSNTGLSLPHLAMN